MVPRHQRVSPPVRLPRNQAQAGAAHAHVSIGPPFESIALRKLPRSCSVSYGGIRPPTAGGAAAAPVTIRAGTCQLSTDNSTGHFSIFASRGTDVLFVSGLVRRVLEPPAVPNPAAAPAPTGTREVVVAGVHGMGWRARGGRWRAACMPCAAQRGRAKPAPPVLRSPLAHAAAIEFVAVVEDDCVLACKGANGEKGLVPVTFGHDTRFLCSATDGNETVYGEPCAQAPHQQRRAGPVTAATCKCNSSHMRTHVLALRCRRGPRRGRLCMWLGQPPGRAEGNQSGLARGQLQVRMHQ